MTRLPTTPRKPPETLRRPNALRQPKLADDLLANLGRSSQRLFLLGLPPEQPSDRRGQVGRRIGEYDARTQRRRPGELPSLQATAECLNVLAVLEQINGSYGLFPDPI